MTAPFYTYNHSAKVVANETCPPASSAMAGLAFYSGGAYPAQYHGALFFADYIRDCIWAMLPGANGEPYSANRLTFVAAGSQSSRNSTIGPGGDLSTPILMAAGSCASGPRHPPRRNATPSCGPAPLTVAFTGSASSDPDGQPLQYTWDSTLTARSMTPSVNGRPTPNTAAGTRHRTPEGH